ncbi:MAG: hypothetical protein AB8G16_19035 [Gammaproteobacteria bacterium]
MIEADKLNATPLELEDEDIRLVDGKRAVPLSLTDNGPWRDLAPVAAQSDYERRRESRDNPPRMAWRLSLQKRFNILVGRLTKSRVWKAAFIAVFCLSLMLIWYTANYRIALIDGVYSDLTIRGQLETELLEKNREWSAERMAALSESVARADRRRVFFDYATLAQWLADEREVANAMALDFSYTLAQTQSSRMAHVDEVAVSIQISVPDTHAVGAYMDLMRFMREMIKTPWYVEIVDAAITSNPRGANGLEAELRIWVHDEVNAGE